MNIDIQKLKAAALAATQGKWEWDGKVWDYDRYIEAPWLVNEDNKQVLTGAISATKANAEYIAAANPAAILSLIAALESAAAPQPVALHDVVKYTRLARGIQNPAGSYPNGPWEDFYACDDVVRAIASAPQPAQAALSDEQIDELIKVHTKSIPHNDGDGVYYLDFFEKKNFARAILAASQQPAAAPVQAECDSSMQGMADCMDMVRQELIEAGIIGKDVAPMFVADAVMFHIKALRALVQAAPVQAAVVPEGYVLVPLKITEDMHVAAVRAVVNANGNDDFPRTVWAAMLSAAPQSQTKEWVNAACKACEGLTMDHFDGGWTALGLSKYAKSLEKLDAAFKDACTVAGAVSYTHLRAHETRSNLVCRLLLEKR